MPKVLMLDKTGKPYHVEEQDFDAAINEGGLEPAFEMIKPEGGKAYVRKSLYNEARKSGLKDAAEVTAEREANERYKTDLKNTKVNPIESAARGFANATTGGFADEIQAAVKNPKGALKSLGGVLGMDMSDDKDVGAYQRARDDYRAADEESYEQNPWSHRVGNVAGMAGAGFASSVPQTVGAAARMGAAQGAVQGVGGSNADLSKGEVGKTARDAVIGGSIGAGSGALGQYISNWAAQNGPRDLAKKFAYAATGGKRRELNKLGKKTADDIGGTLLDEGGIKFGDRTGGDTMKDRIQGIIDKYSQKESDLLNSIDGTESYGNLRSKMLNEINDASSSAGVGNEKYRNALESELQNLEGRYAPTRNVETVVGGRPNATSTVKSPDAELTPQELLKLKNDYNQASRFDSVTEAAPAEAAKSTRQQIAKTLDEFVGNRTTPETAAAYRADRLKESDLHSAMKAIAQTQKDRQANKLLGLTDYELLGGGLAGMASGVAANPFAAVATGLGIGAKKIGENFGASSSAVMLNEAQKLINKYGLDEGMKRLSNAVGPRLAEQMVQRLQQSTTQGRE